MTTKYLASISPSSAATGCFNSVKGVSVSTVNAGSLVTDNSSTSLENNQAILKNLPFSWWIAQLNSGAIQYRPVSGLVNWAFVVNGQDVHITREITDVVIPNRTDSCTRDEVAKTTSLVQKDNGCLLLTKTIPLLM